AGRVTSLLILGGNPVYNAPADLEFAAALSQVPFKAHWALSADETSELCDWHLPACHFLEAWGDARAFDGTVSLIQPLIRPLYAGKTAHEVLDGLMGGARRTRDMVRDHWKAARGVSDKGFEAWLEKGIIPGTARTARTVTASTGAIAASSPVSSEGLELLLLPDPFIHDGRYANNPWLQELQKPFTSMTWDNTVQMSPRTAELQNLVNHDVVEVELSGRKTKGAVWVVPGMADETIAIHLGFGRKKGGVIAEGPGFDAYVLRQSQFSSYIVGPLLKKVDSNFPLAATHGHHQTEGRDIVRTGTLAELAANPSLAPESYHKPDESKNLYQSGDFKYDGNKWAMTIDLNLCIGCNACVTACQAENNIPNVGKEQVIRQRELHWMRIDRYYLGDINSPDEIVFQPLTCMHCEQAPCEPVCPVAATVHSKEGLNQMVYNRCVGTRYCSNNCPYKVRRFNYINYGDRHDYPSTEDKKRPAPTLKLLQNPDVTVRGRGVMEKCTYCVQRINEARIDAKKHGREIEDGEIVTACQQACPTRAITFGNMADPNSAVSKTRADGRNYLLLEELQTKPRTTYLGKVRNPNPNL
ncbi:MAG TPA: 4Fe-4S dicluster domain-containing protein, partial [Fimbriimonadaceae bacterium]|nr:4Fe-4S dicluster domain-containing protein [Fimbriimonadaceae bacterium]